MPPDNPPVLEYAKLDVKTWTVGTLVYTVGGLTLLFFWLLLGDFALSLRERSVGQVVQLFLKREGVSDTTMALLMTSLPPLLGLIIGPIVAYRSDRLRSRWGRRIPFLLIPTPIAAVAMVGIALTPWIAGGLYSVLGERFSLGACTIAVFGVLWTTFEIAVIVSGPVFTGLINDVVPRPVLGRFFAMFRAVSLIDGMIFNYFLLKHAETHFQAIFIGVASVFGFGFVLMCLKVKEGQYPPPHQLESDRPEERGLIHAVGTYFRECYSHPHYLWIFGTITLAAITFAPINTFTIFYAKKLQIDMGYYGELMTASYFVSLALAYPLGSLVDRFHPLRVALVAMLIYAVATAWGAFSIVDSRTFGIALVAHVVLSGTYFTAAASLGSRLLPRSKFSQFDSAGRVVTAIAMMCIGPTMGQILDHTGHNYRLTYLAAFILSCISSVMLFIVNRRFMAMGGPKGYIAPGDTPTDVVSVASAGRGH